MSDTRGIGILKKDGQEIYPRTKAEAVSYIDSKGNRKTVQILVAEVDAEISRAKAKESSIVAELEALKNNAPQFKGGMTWNELEGGITWNKLEGLTN